MLLTSEKAYVLIAFLCYPFICRCSVVPLKFENISSVIDNNHLVLVNFFAGWCRFSQLLEPIFMEAANKAKELFPESEKVVFAEVNCDDERDITVNFRINKYPTLKLFRDGKMVRKEYRGPRRVHALLSYIRTQLSNNIRELESFDDVLNLPTNGSEIVGFFEANDSVHYSSFVKTAAVLRDDCDFYALLGNASRDKVVFKPIEIDEPSQVFAGNLSNSTDLISWALDKCVPLVRKISFGNAEELTEEGRNFLVLFRNEDDVESLKMFRAAATRLRDFEDSFNFLEADCLTFDLPLRQLEKSARDCPLLVIDSFRHLHLFPNLEDIKVEGKLKQFLLDFQSGKLHRELHNGPDVKLKVVKEAKSFEKKTQIKMKPFYFKTRESIFRKLKPSKYRYTFDKRDEL